VVPTPLLFLRENAIIEKRLKSKQRRYTKAIKEGYRGSRHE
jgi:hypothetical protein